MSLRVEYCGETWEIERGRSFTVGREGDLVIDDNAYLHRRFLRIDHAQDMWWLANIGNALTATVAAERGLMQAWLAPGGRLPIVFDRTTVWFTAGATTYDFVIEVDDAAFTPPADEVTASGGTTMGRTSFTPDQHLLLLALAEPVLRRGDRGQGRIPSTAEAATRLGWTTTKFNRKLDNVCQKLVKHGVRGLHGNAEQLAANRRARLVEYAVTARLVSPEDLPFLDAHVRDHAVRGVAG